MPIHKKFKRTEFGYLNSLCIIENIHVIHPVPKIAKSAKTFLLPFAVKTGGNVYSAKIQKLYLPGGNRIKDKIQEVYPAVNFGGSTL